MIRPSGEDFNLVKQSSRAPILVSGAAIATLSVTAIRADAPIESATEDLSRKPERSNVFEESRTATRDTLLAPIEYFLGLLLDVPGVLPDYQFESSSWYRLAAERGHIDAQARLGDRYASGAGLERNLDEAARWWRLAASQGQRNALERLVTFYRDSDDVVGKIKWTRLAAENGIADGQFRMGWYYHVGDGVPKDAEEERKWYLLAAEQGHMYAQANLGISLAQGRDGASQDYRKSIAWLIAAADQGHSNAIAWLGHLLVGEDQATESETRAASEVIRQRALEGNLEAQFRLGALYQHGVGVPQSKEEATRWFLKAAANGHDAAQYDVGMNYRSGEGVARDFEIAFFWLLASAEQENSRAQYEVAEILFDGRGVPPDKVASHEWMEKAASQGYAPAMVRMGRNYEYGHGVPRDQSVALIWYRLAANKGQGWAMYKIGHHLITKDDGMRSRIDAEAIEGLRWIILAEWGGIRNAKETMDRIDHLVELGTEPELPELLDTARRHAKNWRDDFLARGGKYQEYEPAERIER